LINDGVIRGYDDPRLYTSLGMKRRGITPVAINYFCDCLSVTRTNNTTTIQVEHFESVIRKDMNENCERTIGVIDPIKLILEDMKDDEIVANKYQGLKWPGNKEKVNETYSITLTKEVYVERADCREDDSKDFFGIAPGKTIR